jgi:predicted nucleotide-binding protein
MSTELDAELESIAADAAAIASGVDPFADAIKTLETAVNDAGKAWSGSWLGYHSRVYYKGLQPPPPGAHFDPASGLMGRHISDTRGEWGEFDYDQVYDAIKSVVDDTTFQGLQDAANSARKSVGDLRERLVSILTAINEKTENQYVEKLLKDAEGAKCVSAQKFVEYFRPSGQFMSRDMVAINNGLQTPPHIALCALVQAMESPFNAANAIAKVASRVREHIQHRKSSTAHATSGGGKVFIGHGRSHAWRDLKDFLQDRLSLPWDEFNRVPIAGVTNIARLSQMLDDASIAFLLMTAEDEQKDGKVHARMNVIHEAGLFQGRLGFSRAIVVLEDGCEEFSNIQGLGQLRFPAGNISAIFEDIREVLEREGLLE